MPLNVEIKARCENAALIQERLRQRDAEYRGCDSQVDTYFRVADGRLKLREGKIENNLIFYRRPDQPGPKDSEFYLYPCSDPPALKRLLTAAHGLLAVVEKQRHIYYVDNVKFHIDHVSGLGDFVEIEAGDLLRPATQPQLLGQCNEYMELFEIRDDMLLDCSYCDLILRSGDSGDR